MNNIDQQIADWLDGEGVDSVEELVSESTEQVASSLLLHGILSEIGSRDEMKDSERMNAVLAAIRDESAEPLKSDSSHDHGRRHVALLTTVVSIAAVLILAVMFAGPQQRVAAAMATLDQVIESARLPVDRMYEISVVEDYPRDKRPRGLPEDRWQREPKEQIDGATLHVRGTDKYVLIRALQDGRRRITGCDGEQSWAFREDGPVHVSSDLSRFRGGMPGGQQDFPLINIHSHLSQLKDGYDIELTDEKQRTADGVELSQLAGSRKSRDVRGPKQVDIWFNPADGSVHQMLLSGLPRGGGGPKSVSLKLIDQSDLGPDFFHHESHHEPDRRVRYEK